MPSPQRGRDPKVAISDLSVIVTSTLLYCSAPLCAMVAHRDWRADLSALGQASIWWPRVNPFNPAMVGYVVLLVSFPVQMSAWAPPRGLAEVPELGDTLRHLFAPGTIDAVTAATPLDLLRQNTGLLFDDLMNNRPELDGWGGVGWLQTNIAFLIGGIWLLYRKIFTWHAPLAMLAALGLCALMGYDGGSSESGGSALFHLFSGATMFAAFFIITDPVSSAVSIQGKLIFGALIGVLVYLIRVLGNYPDAVAFAVLILNFCAPFIDHYTQPKVYGTRSKDA